MRFPRLPKTTKVMEAVFLTRDTTIGRSSFLTSKFHANETVEFADLSEQDHVCEIGAGFGVLSEEILKKKVKSLLSVEWNRLCSNHLAKFPKYNSNHVVKHGDPFFLDYNKEFSDIPKDTDSTFTIFVNLPLFERNYFYVEQMLEDLVHNKQAFSFPKTKIITFIEAKKASRICGNVLIPGKTQELLIQNYFKTELGPVIGRNNFKEITVSDCCAVKLVPLPRPIIDIEFSRLQDLVFCLSGGRPGFSKKTIEYNLRSLGVINPHNEAEFYAACQETYLDLNQHQRDLTFVDIMKYTNILHLFPERIDSELQIEDL